MEPVAYFSTLARHNVWATQRLLDTVAVLDEPNYRRDVGLFFKSIHGTLNHLVVTGELLWLPRFVEGVSLQVQLSAEVEAERHLLARRLHEGALQWQALVCALPASRYDAPLCYRTMRGTQAALPFPATLTHVFMHATHHRGQITAALTALGRPCPELDLVYLLQEEQVLA